MPRLYPPRIDRARTAHGSAGFRRGKLWNRGQIDLIWAARYTRTCDYSDFRVARSLSRNLQVDATNKGDGDLAKGRTGYTNSGIDPCGSSSVVEHRLAKARVASSNLVSRSNRPPAPAGLARVVGSKSSKKAALPRRGTQVVRERSAKPLCAGSIPARASNSSGISHPNSMT